MKIYLLACFLCLIMVGIGISNRVNAQQYGMTMQQRTIKSISGNVNKAIAIINPTAGNQVQGTVTFTQVGNNIKVVADIRGLSPGTHGFHIHEFGDCSASDATSAGSHYNPTNSPHAGPTAEHRHIGDLGNIEAPANGTAHLEWVDNFLKLEGPNSIIGRAVIVHSKADDLKTQPTGDAGGRVGCGVIGVMK